MKTKFRSIGRHRKGQQGAALVVALIMLILVSLLGAAGFFMSTTEARGATGWSDRQRALFAAEGALKEAEAAVKTLVASNTTVDTRQLVSGRTGYYIRHDSTVPDVSVATNWTTSNAISATTATDLSGKVFYFIVYEGAAPTLDQGLLQGNGNVNQSATRPRFTLYAMAGGYKDGTQVVLSTSEEF